MLMLRVGGRAGGRWSGSGLRLLEIGSILSSAGVTLTLLSAKTGAGRGWLELERLQGQTSWKPQPHTSTEREEADLRGTSEGNHKPAEFRDGAFVEKPESPARNLKAKAKNKSTGIQCKKFCFSLDDNFRHSDLSSKSSILRTTGCQ